MDKEDYERHMKYDRDFKNMVDTAFEKGFKKGKERSIERGKKIGVLKTAKKFKEIGVSIEIIMKSTGLSREEIEKM